MILRRKLAAYANTLQSLRVLYAIYKSLLFSLNLLIFANFKLAAYTRGFIYFNYHSCIDVSTMFQVLQYV